MTDALHFIGIGGIGMSALARIALARGFIVTGSTDRESAITQRLQSEGATLYVGHKAEHIVGRPRVVVTSAVAADNPELSAAQAQGLMILGRGALLAEWFNGTRGVAIAGTHGKTTVTAMTATVFEHAGYDPTVAVGGERRESGTNFRCGASPWFVTESDESDGSFLALRPEIAVVTNVENDHVSTDAEAAHLREQFTTFIGTIPSTGRFICGIDDAGSAALLKHPTDAPTWTFGFHPHATIAGTEPTYGATTPFGSSCTVRAHDRLLGTLQLQVPGEMNLRNALAATAVGLAVGIPFATIAAALATFRGVRRRFDVLTSSDATAIVIDDYAHHPTAVAATIAAARHALPQHRLVVAFQPHRYTRTAYLADDFAQALRDADQVILTDIYAASERPIPGVSEELIAATLRSHGGNVTTLRRTELVARLQKITETTTDRCCILLLGAGDITAAAHELANRIDRIPAQR